MMSSPNHHKRKHAPDHQQSQPPPAKRALLPPQVKHILAPARRIHLGPRPHSSRPRPRSLIRMPHVDADLLQNAPPACPARALSPYQLRTYHSLHLLLPPLPRLSHRHHYPLPPPLASPSLDPPISHTSLAELELSHILSNSQLRHDVFFDPHLVFRPNFAGDLGRRKRLAAERYWLALHNEIASGCRCTVFIDSAVSSSSSSATSSSSHSSSSSHFHLVTAPCLCSPPFSSLRSKLPSRIPPLVSALQAILLSILPSENNSNGNNTASLSSSAPDSCSASHSTVVTILDPDLIYQQIQHNVFDLQALATFLGQTLKMHCAPMRDKLIDSMVHSLKRDSSDPQSIVSGLRMAFEILELMKLDIANHQLRTLRPYLLETAQDFEQRSFKQALERRHRRHLEQHQHLSNNVNTSSSPMSSRIDTNVLLPRATRWFVTSAQSILAESPGIDNALLIDRAILKGLAGLVFSPQWNPCSCQPPGAYRTVTSPPSSHPSSWSRHSHHFRHQLPSAAPSPSRIPETLQLDISRLQFLHADITDLTIAYMIILFTSQLVASNQQKTSSLRTSDISAQCSSLVWAALLDARSVRHSSSSTESVTANNRPLKTVATTTTMAEEFGYGTPEIGPESGFARIDCDRWRNSFKDALSMNLAKLVSPTADDSSINTCKGVITKWIDTNLRVGSIIFHTCFKRLVETIETAAAEDAATASTARRDNLFTKSGSFNRPSSSSSWASTSPRVSTSKAEHINLQSLHISSSSPPSTPPASTLSNTTFLPTSPTSSRKRRRSSIDDFKCELGRSKSSNDGIPTTSTTNGDKSRHKPFRKLDSIKPLNSSFHCSLPVVNSPTSTAKNTSSPKAFPAIKRRSSSASSFSGMKPKKEGDVVVSESNVWNELLKKNGMVSLSAEIKSITTRLAKLAVYHAAVYHPWYASLFKHHFPSKPSVPLIPVETNECGSTRLANAAVLENRLHSTDENNAPACKFDPGSEISDCATSLNDSTHVPTSPRSTSVCTLPPSEDQ